MFYTIGLPFHCFTMLLNLWTWLVIEEGCGLGVFGCVSEGCVFLLLCCQYFHLLSSLILILWFIWISWIMVKWIVVMKIQPNICLDAWVKPRKNPSQIGRHRDSNPGHLECESRVLPRSHLARFVEYCISSFIWISIIHFLIILIHESKQINK